MFFNVKFSEILKKWNLLKTTQITCPIESYIICSRFYYKKNDTFELKTNKKKINKNTEKNSLNTT